MNDYFIFSDPSIAQYVWRRIYFELRLNAGSSMYPCPLPDEAGELWALICTAQVKENTELYAFCVENADGGVIQAE